MTEVVELEEALIHLIDETLVVFRHRELVAVNEVEDLLLDLRLLITQASALS